MRVLTRGTEYDASMRDLYGKVHVGLFSAAFCGGKV